MTSNNWIFLRGLTRGNIHWGHFQEIFKRLNPTAEMEFLELPGNGTLNKESSKVNPKQVVEFLRERSVFVQKNLPFHICGISLGGMVALKWAELYPQNIESVSIINSSLKQFSPFYERLIPNNFGKIGLALFNSDPTEQEKIILSITSNEFPKTEKFISIFADFAKEHKISKTNFAKQLLLATNVKIEKLSDIPLNIISSKNDRLVRSLCSDKIFGRFGGKQYIHPTAGHDLPLDDPEWLGRILITQFQ